MSETRQIVVPGERVAKKGELLPGQNTYEEADGVYALRLGVKSVRGDRVNVISLSGRYEPYRGDMVIGTIAEVGPSNWYVNIGAANDVGMHVNDVPWRVEFGETSKYLAVGDSVLLKIVHVDEMKKAQVSMKDRQCRKLAGGLIHDVAPSKVPRIVGRQGSMIQMIKDATSVRIFVGQNGLVWLDGEPEDVALALEALRKIEAEAHTSGLTDRMKAWLEERRPTASRPKKAEPEEEPAEEPETREERPPRRDARPPREDRPMREAPAFREERPPREERPLREAPAYREERPLREAPAYREERPVREAPAFREERGVREDRPAREDRAPRDARPAREERRGPIGRPESAKRRAIRDDEDEDEEPAPREEVAPARPQPRVRRPAADEEEDERPRSRAPQPVSRREAPDADDDEDEGGNAPVRRVPGPEGGRREGPPRGRGGPPPRSGGDRRGGNGGGGGQRRGNGGNGGRGDERRGGGGGGHGRPRRDNKED